MDPHRIRRHGGGGNLAPLAARVRPGAVAAARRFFRFRRGDVRAAAPLALRLARAGGAR